MSEKDEALGKYIAFRKLCIQNAKDNLKAAALLKGQNVNHLVFHLSILALEEVGKIFMSYIKLTQKEKWDAPTLKVPLDDHVKKLFYATWSPSIGTELIDKKQWANYQMEATQLHDVRLKTLYGDIDDIISSAQKVEDGLAEAVWKFAEARLHLAEMEGEKEINPSINPDFIWFEEMVEQKENHLFFFGSTAQNKLIELDDVNKWLAWLKKTKTEENKQSIDLGIKEIERTLPDSIDDIKPKWEITYTIATPSHSIKPADLSAFNKLERFPIILFPGKDKRTLIIKLTLGNDVSVKDLFHFGWHLCKLYVAALNIATNGIFYWNIKTDGTKYYDKIFDLEKKKNLEVRLEDKSVNWKTKNQFLSQQQMIVSSIVYEYLLTITSKEDASAIQLYSHGLGMLGKTDIHLRLENLAFASFYDAFKTLVLANQKDANLENFASIAFEQINKMLITKEDFDSVMLTGNTFEKTSLIDRDISIEEVLSIKSYCEKYFLTLACRRQHKDANLYLTLE